MGHQITFYMNPTDIRDVENKICGLGSMIILHSNSSYPKPRVVDSLNFTENGQRWLYFRLVRPQELNLVRMQEIPARSMWSVDSLNSPVVEFHCGFFNGELLRDGRVYWLDDFYA